MKKNNNKLETTVKGISTNHKVSFLEVLRVYSNYRARVYNRSLKRGEKFEFYNPKLEEEVFKLTERYFNIYGGEKWKETEENWEEQ